MFDPAPLQPVAPEEIEAALLMQSVRQLAAS
jgi:hypothetical protein